MIFLLVSLKKNILSQKFQELLKKLFCLGLVMFCFFYINLHYSVITLPSHYSTKNIFTSCCSHVSLCKNNSFHLQTRRALFSSFEHVHSSFGKMMVKKLHVETYLEKHHPSRKEFIICKSKNSLVKNLQFSWDRIVRTCNLKCIF